MAKARLDIVDFHSHILPCADHGSSSLDTTLYQLKQAARNSVKRIIATPHFYPMNDDVSGFIERRRVAYETLLPSLGDDTPCVKLGAEVMMCTGLERLPGLERLFVNGTSTLLIELPLSGFQSEYADSALRLVEQGVSVILAHPERYSGYAVEAMLESGVKLQCNAYTLARRSKLKTVIPWLASEHIVALGSDIHQSDSSAYKNFAKAIVRLGDYAERIQTYTDDVWNLAKSSIE